jgi:hypothetical protein
MNYQDKRPELSVFALAILFVLAIMSQFGGEWWQVPAGCILLGGGAWATWKVGRWGWWRYAQRGGYEMIR